MDNAGNWSAWRYGTSFRVSLPQQTTTAIAWYGTWRTTSTTAASGGSLRYATSSTARARFSFTGRSVSWVSATGPTRRSAAIYVDGRWVKTISLYATTTSYRKVVFSKTWSSVGYHKIEIRVRGTKGHPRVDVDAFVVLKKP